MQPNTALIDLSSKILLSLGWHGAAVVYVCKHMPDTTYISTIAFPNYLHSSFLSSIKPEDFTKWTWDLAGRKFTETRPDVITEHLRFRSQLAFAKQKAVSEMMYALSALRHEIGTGVSYEETVYLTKRMEAERFKEKGYIDENMRMYPYVTQYAEIAGCSDKQAADDILLAAKLDEEILLQTEALRLRFFKKLAEADSVEAPSAILKEFYTILSTNNLS